MVKKYQKKYRLEYKGEKNHTRKKLAELINVSVSLISSLESNKTKERNKH
ncbi:MAG: helix-turn-helix transcriptional regulator [Clostridium sp.]|nr:MAG: helix-turn-helix transcriptional regulator [Clostridium sp.]